MRDASPSSTATVRTGSTATATATVLVAAMLAETGLIAATSPLKFRTNLVSNPAGFEFMLNSSRGGAFGLRHSKRAGPFPFSASKFVRVTSQSRLRRNQFFAVFPDRPGALFFVALSPGLVVKLLSREPEELGNLLRTAQEIVG